MKLNLSVTKLVKEEKKNQLKYYRMVLYAIKTLLPYKRNIKNIPTQ